MKANVYEIFSSYQGEGLWAGQKHIFVRFSGCNLSCFYCDEDAAVINGKNFSVKEVINEIKKISGQENVYVISFTGGEPLINADFIKEIIVRLGERYLYLIETNGILYKELKKVLKLVNIVSVDIKLPSMCGLKLWKEHRKFLEIAFPKLYVKVVVCMSTPLKEFGKAVKIVSAINDKIPFFIQPENREFCKTKSILKYEHYYNFAAQRLKDVRIMPQLHKIWKIK